MKKALLAAGLGALCVVLAFPTVGWGWPIVLAYVPALVVMRDLESTRQRFLMGLVLGAAYHAFLFRWIVFTAREMSGLPVAVGAGLLLVFALWHGLFSGLFLAVAEPLRRAVAARRPGLAPLALAAVYAAMEWVWPFLFPLGLGHALWEVPPLFGLASLTGIPGLSFGIMLVSAALADGVRDRTPRHAVAAGVTVVALAAYAVGWWAFLESHEPRRVLRTAIVQMNYTLQEKKRPTFALRTQLLGRFEATLRSIPAGEYDLIFASEGAFPLWWRVDAEDFAGRRDSAVPVSVVATRRVLRAVAEGPRTHLIAGGLRRPPGEGEKTRNAAVHIDPTGRIVGVYDKNVLVPFGEYLPGTSIFPQLAGSIRGISDFAGGDEPCRFEVDGEVLACGVCYEALLTGFTRAGIGDAGALLNLTIDVWFGDSTAPPFHLMGQSARAAELGLPLVRAALTGISAVTGPAGGVESSLALDDKGVMSVDVPIHGIMTPYRAVGPVFGWLMLLVSLSLLAWFRRQRG